MAARDQLQAHGTAGNDCNTHATLTDVLLTKNPEIESIYSLGSEKETGNPASLAS